VRVSRTYRAIRASSYERAVRASRRVGGRKREGALYRRAPRSLAWALHNRPLSTHQLPSEPYFSTAAEARAASGLKYSYKAVPGIFVGKRLSFVIGSQSVLASFDVVQADPEVACRTTTATAEIVKRIYERTRIGGLVVERGAWKRGETGRGVGRMGAGRGRGSRVARVAKQHARYREARRGQAVSVCI